MKTNWSYVAKMLGVDETTFYLKMYNMARAARVRGEMLDARNILEDAITIRKKNCPVDLNLVRFFTLKARISVELCDWAEALKLYLNCIVMLQQMLGEVNEKFYDTDVLKTLCTLGYNSENVQGWESAKRFLYDINYTLRRHIDKSNIESVSCAVLRMLANIHRIQGNSVEAQRTLEEFLIIRSQLKKSADAGNTAVVQILVTLGNIARKRGKLNKAEVFCAEAIEMLEFLKRTDIEGHYTVDAFHCLG